MLFSAALDDEQGFHRTAARSAAQLFTDAQPASMKRLGLILIAALVWPTYVYGGRPSPPALRNPQDPVSYGADRSGVGDSTAAFQKAIQQGDLNIATPGLYKINGPVTVPSDRNIRCGPGTAATSTYAITPGNPKGNYTIFDWRGTNHGSLFGCQFRGENYNAPGKPAYDNTFQKAVLIESIGNAGTTGYVTIANNDFNGIGGFVAAVQIYGNDVNQPGPTRNLITYNKSEHCGYRAVEINSGTYNMVSYNTNVDCGDGVEQQDQLMQQGHNTFDHNTYAYPNGTGQGAGRGESIHWNSVSAGAACHGSGANGFCQGSEHVDYSTNTVSNSIITGLIPNGLVIGNSKTCSNTGLDTPFDVALDSSRRIYVANLGGNNILIFAAGANGNVPPVSAIAGANTKLNGPTALAFDSGGKLYVANEFGSVTVYAAGATGNVGPLRTIAGPHTTLSQPLGIALDSKQRVFVADGVDRIAVFNAGANGDVPPAAVVAGANTRLNGVNDVAVIAAPTPTARPTSTPQPLVARMSALMPDIPVPRLQVDEVDATVKVVLVGSGLGVFRSARDYWPWSRFNTGVGTIVPVSEIEQNENRIPFPETGERGAYGVIAAVVTPTPTPSRTPTSTPKTSPTPTRTKTATRTPTRTATRGPTPSPSRTVTRTPIRTPTKTPTRTPTRTATRKATPSPTRTPLPTMAPPLYVANAFSNNVTKYPPNANGNVAPAAILGGVSTGISNPQSLTLDKLGRAYVVNSGAAASITVYAAGAKGNTPPLAMIAGPTTRLDIPVGIAVDPAGRILVTNLSSVSTTYDSVLIFNAGANGNQAPAATISGGGNSVIPGVYVNNTCTQGCQVVCPPGSNPPATPVATTAGVPDAASFRDLPHPNQFAAGQEFRRRIEKRRNRP